MAQCCTLCFGIIFRGFISDIMCFSINVQQTKLDTKLRTDKFSWSYANTRNLLYIIPLSDSPDVFLTKQWYEILVYTGNLFIIACQRITYKKDLKNHIKGCVFGMKCFYLWFLALMCFFTIDYLRSINEHRFEKNAQVTWSFYFLRLVGINRLMPQCTKMFDYMQNKNLNYSKYCLASFCPNELIICIIQFMSSCFLQYFPLILVFQVGNLPIWVGLFPLVLCL